MLLPPGQQHFTMYGSAPSFNSSCTKWLLCVLCKTFCSHNYTARTRRFAFYLFWFCTDLKCVLINKVQVHHFTFVNKYKCDQTFGCCHNWCSNNLTCDVYTTAHILGQMVSILLPNIMLSSGRVSYRNQVCQHCSFQSWYTFNLTLVTRMPARSDVFGSPSPLREDELPTISDVILFARYLQDNSKQPVSLNSQG